VNKQSSVNCIKRNSKGHLALLCCQPPAIILPESGCARRNGAAGSNGTLFFAVVPSEKRGNAFLSPGSCGLGRGRCGWCFFFRAWKLMQAPFVFSGDDKVWLCGLDYLKKKEKIEKANISSIFKLL
jgi:hypothetical protein